MKILIYEIAEGMEGWKDGGREGKREPYQLNYYKGN